MEAAELSRLTHLGNEILVLGNGQSGVAAVRGIGEGLEELAFSADEGIGILQKIPEATNVGESGELNGAQELHEPGLDAGAGKARLGVTPMVKLGVLFNRSFEFSAILARGPAHPLLNRGGGYDGDSVGLRGLQS